MIFYILLYIAFSFVSGLIIDRILLNKYMIHIIDDDLYILGDKVSEINFVINKEYETWKSFLFDMKKANTYFNIKLTEEYEPIKLLSLYNPVCLILIAISMWPIFIIKKTYVNLQARNK